MTRWADQAARLSYFSQGIPIPARPTCSLTATAWKWRRFGCIRNKLAPTARAKFASL
ncbi:unnamed protein product [Protopolystoma xenopodis]|uniref:Uncharacterized protein n=1 Tax=Protopolystoma xenopodis TaxID=117903 RepID=A0A3S5CRW5_9PLAT|nr:unnamed protein product [Protopolystoma xenopodis]